ncbi:MAG: branched-chain amino acid ABC transporter permease [Gammaproteobacteria bacterium]|nr:branched-chain amino acid ABC transporter permease [Gammaproteobacteria bacterium]NIR84898.1 branched-chain amino acid ABC transporter permease [Gammaproteobacteria bacterium]NIR91747.1 branched-chain amino acid ABC transporter permease [Gammaproteobacteria bacterium]NIU05945.1 branched-chain amino acid ABC transporter permease [Gammaproteobacteria bacterium]NIV52992.1 branched-chain amino acid ABC transporter permease [Gammaproteobacteria bacterium]
MDLGLLLEPVILAEVLLQGFVRGSMYALMGVGLSLIFGIMGVKNFSHGELFMLGTYVMFFVSVLMGLPFLAGIIGAAVVLFLVGMLIERGLVEPLRKRAGRDWLLDSFVLTIGLMVLLQNLALIVFGSRRRGITQMVEGSLQLGDIIISYERLVILAMATLTVVLLWAFIKYTSLGKAIRATSQDPESAQTLGIDINRVYTYTFGLGAALAGIAGALLISIFPAYPTVGFQPIIKSIAVVILGGLGNVPGAIAAGLLLGVIEAYTIFFMSAGWQQVMTALLVVLILMFRPYGLFSSVKEERP